MSKLAIAAETESDKYDTHTAVFCYDCGYKEVERTTANVSNPMAVLAVITNADGVVGHSCQRLSTVL